MIADNSHFKCSVNISKYISDFFSFLLIANTAAVWFVIACQSVSQLLITSISMLVLNVFFPHIPSYNLYTCVTWNERFIGNFFTHFMGSTLLWNCIHMIYLFNKITMIFFVGLLTTFFLLLLSNNFDFIIIYWRSYVCYLTLSTL